MEPGFYGLLLAPKALTPARLDSALAEGYTAVVMDLTAPRADSVALDLEVLDRFSELTRYGWIDVGRDDVAAALHPEWLHRPHKRQYYGFEEVAIYPWVSVNNRAVFDYELARVTRLLQSAAGANLRGVFLNDLQAAPEGCGCGNAICRMWDNSLGPKLSGETHFGDRPVAPRRFVEAVEGAFGGLDVIGVITETCEAGVTVAGVKDPEVTLGFGDRNCAHPDGLETYPKLIADLSGLGTVGLLALYKVFGRDHPAYGDGTEAAWVGGILDRYRSYDAATPIIAVIQGWDVTAEEVRAQRDQAIAHGAVGVLVCGTPVDQSWKLIPAPPRATRI